MKENDDLCDGEEGEWPCYHADRGWVTDPPPPGSLLNNSLLGGGPAHTDHKTHGRKLQIIKLIQPSLHLRLL